MLIRRFSVRLDSYRGVLTRFRESRHPRTSPPVLPGSGYWLGVEPKADPGVPTFPGLSSPLHSVQAASGPHRAGSDPDGEVAPIPPASTVRFTTTSETFVW